MPNHSTGRLGHVSRVTRKSEPARTEAQAPKPAQPAGAAAELQRALAQPALSAPAALLAMQRTVGNRAVQRLMAASRPVQRAPQRAPSPPRTDPARLNGGPVESSIESDIQRAGGGKSIEAGLRGSMEQSLGSNFSRVRVHTDARADRLNRSLSAKAFTVGSDVFFRQGAYSPSSSSGKQLLAHELTHVVQQGGDNSTPRIQGKLTVGPASDRYEAEADRMAGKVMGTRGGPIANSSQALASIRRAPAIQRTVIAGGIPILAENLTKTGVKIEGRGDVAIGDTSSNIPRNRLRKFINEDRIHTLASVEDLVRYVSNYEDNRDLATISVPEEPPQTEQPEQQQQEDNQPQSKVKGKWWKWPLSVLAMVPGIGGAIAGAKAGVKHGKSGGSKIGWGILGGIGGFLGGLIAPAIGAIAGAALGAKGGAQAAWNKFMRGKKWYHGLYAWLPALLGGVGGAVGGSLLGATATSLALGPMAVDSEMVNEDLGKNKKVEDAKRNKKVGYNAMQKGDIVLVHGGEDMGTGLIKYGQFFHQLWSRGSRGAGTGFRHAGIYVGFGQYAHVTNAGSRQDALENGLVVYRPTTPGLGLEAAKVAMKWSSTMGDIKYSKSKAAGTVFSSSAYSKSQAAILAAYYKNGVTPESMLCSEFAIACYQAAALKPAVDQLNSSSLKDVGDDRAGVDRWGKQNKGLLNTPDHMLKLDPRRTSPQMLAAELTRLGTGENPQWTFEGVTDLSL